MCPLCPFYLRSVPWYSKIRLGRQHAVRDVLGRNPERGERDGTPSYCRPRLALVGAVVRLVQSGTTGNRNETYQGSYWSDK